MSGQAVGTCGGVSQEVQVVLEEVLRVRVTHSSSSRFHCLEPFQFCGHGSSGWFDHKHNVERHAAIQNLITHGHPSIAAKLIDDVSRELGLGELIGNAGGCSCMQVNGCL